MNVQSLTIEDQFPAFSKFSDIQKLRDRNRVSFRAKFLILVKKESWFYKPRKQGTPAQLTLSTRNRELWKKHDYQRRSTGQQTDRQTDIDSIFGSIFIKQISEVII